MFGNRFFAAALLGIILSTAGGKIWAFEVTHKESRGENFEPRFEFRTGPRSVTIIHSGAGYPCCLRLDVEAKLEADRLTVGEIDNSPPCLCPIMPWVIEITVSDLAPGAYEVVLLGPTGKKLAAETVDVPGGGEELFRRGDVEILVCPEREELVNTLGGAALFIGHDSGVTHLSAMLGAPTIALFRNTDPVQWHPLGPGVAVIKAHEQGRKLIERAVTAAKELFGKD